MKTWPSNIILWVLIAFMCVSVISIPISAADKRSDALDAVAGSRSDVCQLLGVVVHDSKYEITTSAGSGGTVSASVSASVPGKTIKIYAEPDGGYKMASIFVITSSGNEIEVLLDDGSYSFVMPGEPVVIDVTFQLMRTA